MPESQKYLYVHPKEGAKELLMRRTSISHSLDLPNGMVITSAEFHFEDERDKFERHNAVQCVAHDGETITEDHAQILGHLGVTAGQTAKQARTALKKINGLL